MNTGDLLPEMQPAAANRLGADGIRRGRLLAKLNELMAFSAPYLEEKLIHLRLVDTRMEALELFQEVKKYLVIAEMHADHKIPMFSVRVDEAWHQFVLFTHEYAEFCDRFAGHFLHHTPDEAPKTKQPTSLGAEVTFQVFRDAYETLFGNLSSLWFDELSVKATTRLVCSPLVQPLAVRTEGDKVLLLHEGEPQAVICSTNRRALAALHFIVREQFFLVRELPGLDQAEAIALCRPLVQFHVLRLLP